MSYLNRGLARYGKGEIDAAIADFTKAIELNPDLAWAHAERGIALLWRGDSAAAQQNLDRALQLDPSLKPIIDERIEAIKKHRQARKQKH